MSFIASGLLPSKRKAVGIVVGLCAVAVIVWVNTRPTLAIAHVVTKATVVAEVMGTGTLEARVGATLASKIAGRIETIAVDQGDRVKAGQVVVRLDGADLLRQVEIARADKAAAEAAVGRAKADAVKSEAVLAGTRRERDRIRELVSKNVMSQIDADKAGDALRIAEAGLGASQSAVTEATLRKTASSRALEYQEALLAETVIRAPFPGLITRRLREPGDVLVPGSAVFSLVATDGLWISAWVDETEMLRLAVGQPARVLFRSTPDEVFVGTVARLGREVDRETREFVVDVLVEKLPKNWGIGQRAEVFVEVDRSEDTLAIPAHLIRRKDGEPGIFVHVDGRSRWRSVTLGLQGRGTVEILSGHEAGAQALEPDGKRTLREGGRVVLR